MDREAAGLAARVMGGSTMRSTGGRHSAGQRDSIRGHDRGSHVEHEATISRPGSSRTTPTYSRPGDIGTYRARSANGRSQHSRTGNPSKRKPARRSGTTASPAAPGTHMPNAPRGRTA